jgi:plasmid stabilization system protein ParE
VRPGDWTVLLSEAADLDFRLILWWTRAQFGDTQAESYGRLIRNGLKLLREGPSAPGVALRNIAGQDVMIFRPHAGRRRASHVLVASIGNDRSILVLRILHERMDLPRYLAPRL